MEEVQEQMDLANEIADAISRPIGETFDEDELNAELDELERQELEGKFTEECMFYSHLILVADFKNVPYSARAWFSCTCYPCRSTSSDRKCVRWCKC